MRRKILVGVMILAMLAFLLPSILPPRQPATPPNKPASPNSERTNTTASVNKVPTFKHEGDLSFTTADEKEVSLALEIADTDEDRQNGLMYRNHLNSDAGMLFVFDKVEPQTFWMKNTYIPLDLLFIDIDSTVIQVTGNALPNSETPIHCPKPTKFVLEVNAGYCQAYGITEGSRISIKAK